MCILALATLALFTICGAVAGLLSYRARILRSQPIPALAVFFEPAGWTPRGARLRMVSLGFALLAAGAFVLFVALVVFGTATCWPAA